MDSASGSLLEYTLRLFPRAWRWIKAAGTPHDRRLRAATIGLVLIAPVAIILFCLVLLILAMAGVDTGMVLAILMLLVVGPVVLVRLRSRQVSSPEQPMQRPDDRADRCSECKKPRHRRFGLAFLSDWRYCPECGAGYCEDCKGLLWTSAARGWTVECLECRHEWSIPMN